MLSNKSSNSLSYIITNDCKNSNIKFLMHFDPVTAVSDLSGGLQDRPL